MKNKKPIDWYYVLEGVMEFLIFGLVFGFVVYVMMSL
tara:strand:- start:505 stop:615 length:111 start_codon:yes stop_codon:yes gene_type:complete